MSENNPIPPAGGVPPKPAEAAKVQPKKETVRIALPPKPTGTPSATIKLPSMPAAAPAPVAAAPSAPIGAPPPPPATSAARSSVPVGTASRPATSTTPPSGARPVPAPAARPAAAPVARKLSGFDIGLGIAALIVALAALVFQLILVVGPWALK